MVAETATLLFYRNITNMDEILQRVQDGKMAAGVVSPTHLYHARQLLVAAHKGLRARAQGALHTKTLYTEVLYNLYPGRSIRDALRTFGVQREGAREAAFVVFGDEDELGAVSSLVRGERLSLDDLREVHDIQTIRDLYKIPPAVSGEEDILNVILTRMATRDLL